MKNKLLLLSALATFGFIIVKAQTPGNYQYQAAQSNYGYNNQQSFQNTSRNAVSKAYIANNNEITIDINGISNIVADSYVAVFNIVQVGQTAVDADQLMNDRISTFKQKLKTLGIDTNKIKIDMLSFVPKYDIQTENKIFSKSYNEVPAGFEMAKNILVRYKNSSELDGIITAAANSEIYDLAKVDYFISNVEKYRDSLRLKCLEEVKKRARTLNIVGFRLDTLNKVIAENFSTTYPESRYFSYQSFSRPSLSALKKKSSSSTPTVNEAQKTTSQFYNQITYDQYDVVINPVVDQPVVQISYSVTVKYFLKKDEPTHNIYYILTPSGETKQFNPR